MAAQVSGEVRGYYAICGRPWDNPTNPEYQDVFCGLVKNALPGLDLIVLDKGDNGDPEKLVDVCCVLFYADDWSGCDSGTVQKIDDRYYWKSLLKDPA